MCDNCDNQLNLTRKCRPFPSASAAAAGGDVAKLLLFLILFKSLGSKKRGNKQIPVSVKEVKVKEKLNQKYNQIQIKNSYWILRAFPRHSSSSSIAATDIVGRVDGS
jgi:hypothetical protein